MATMQGLVNRLRLELSDTRTPFQSSVVGDGFTTRYELPHSPVEGGESFAAFTLSGQTTTTLVQGSDYVLDGLNGVIRLAQPLAAGETLYSRGVASRFFSDDDLTVFLDTAFHQHTHGTGKTLAALPKVEDYLVVLLATIEALYALLNDAAFDIDVNTPEGVSVPRSQRFRQLMEMIEERKQQYKELAEALNVGINRVEMSTLRRVSLRTGRLVPIYVPRELEDSSPPRRIYQAIDQQGAPDIIDPVLAEDITIEQGRPYIRELELGQDIAGAHVRAALRRHEQAMPLFYFKVTVLDAATGRVKLDLGDTSRRRLHFNGDLAWSVIIERPGDRQLVRRGRVFVVERPIL